MDRRSMLRRAAVSGAIAWTAPTVMSETAHAVDFLPGTTCTAKCSPTIGSGSQVGGQLEVLACQQTFFSQIVRARATLTTTGIECPCGGSPTVAVVGPGGGLTFTLSRGSFLFIPPDAPFVFAVAVSVACQDNDGQTIVQACTGTATTPSVQFCVQIGDQLTWASTLSCMPQCT